MDRNIQNVLVVGAGVMGSQIGLQCAMRGFSVVLNDVSEQALERSARSIRLFTDEMVSKGHLTAEEAASALNRIKHVPNPSEAGENAGLLIESVPEIPELKHRVFSRYNQICPSGALFVTNSSSLIPSMLAASTGRPSQFAAMHFNPPVWETRILEIMPHRGTSEATLTGLLDFAKRIGQFPVLLRSETPGYISNTLLNAMNSAALSLVTNGIAKVEEVDRVWMSITKMDVGPFGSLDIVGLDTAYQVTYYWANILGNPAIQANARFLKQFVDKGQLGVKTGRGFYSYPDPAYRRPGFLTGATRYELPEN